MVQFVGVSKFGIRAIIAEIITGVNEIDFPKLFLILFPFHFRVCDEKVIRSYK